MVKFCCAYGCANRFVNGNVFVTQESWSLSETAVDYSRYLPFEILEEIFSYLPVADLVHCSAVSVKWRDASNSDKLWRPICERQWWENPYALCDVKSNFLNERYKFSPPVGSDRISPITDWKLYYCQQKFLSYNWHRGRYVTHWFGENIKPTRRVTFVSKEPNERIFFPIVERVGYHYEFSVMRIEGKPTRVSRLERNTVDEVNVVCVAKDTVAYCVDTQLKLASYKDGSFEVNREFCLLPDANTTTSKQIDLSRLEPLYFIEMNQRYIVAGHELFYFHVWDRESGEKIGFHETSDSIMSALCLYSDCVYFAVEQKKTECFEVYEYNIVSKRLTLIASLAFMVKKIISSELYLVFVMYMDVNHNEVIVYDRARAERETNFLQDTSENWALTEPQVLLEKDLLFYLQALTIKVLRMPSCKVKAEFKVTSTVYSMYSVRHNLIIVRTRSEVEVWDWVLGVKLYTPCVECDAPYLYHDTSRLAVVHQGSGEAKVIGFW